MSRKRAALSLLLAALLATLALGLRHDAAATDWCSGWVCQEWAARYNGPANMGDSANAITVDGSGNIYVTGVSEGLATGNDYATIKYASDGNQQWVARYDGPVNGNDSAFALVIDGAGNVYVTGYSTGSGTGYDYATVKYDSDGNQLWVARYDGPSSQSDYASGLALDGPGNVYVTGYSTGSGTYYDYATVKYDTDGNQQWVARYNGPGNSYDYANALAIDESDNVYVMGISPGSGTGDDYATIKYDSDGNQLWAARYDGPASSYDYAKDMAVDASGNVYITGYSMGSGSSHDYATVKYDSGGNQQWVARYDGPDSRYDLASALAVDSSGSVYVTGGSEGFGTPYAYVTIKYDSDGNQQWVTRYDGPDWGADYADALALDGSGNVYVTGHSNNYVGYPDYATIKYDSDGNELWVARYDGPATGNDGDVPHAVAVDGSDNVYITGSSKGSGTNNDYTTVKYSQLTTPLPSPTPSPTPTSTATPLSRTIAGTVYEFPYCVGYMRGWTVVLNPLGWTTTTSVNDGSFAFHNVPNGSYWLYAGCNGWGLCYPDTPVTVAGSDPLPVSICPEDFVPTATPTPPPAVGGIAEFSHPRAHAGDDGSPWWSPSGVYWVGALLGSALLLAMGGWLAAMRYRG